VGLSKAELVSDALYEKLVGIRIGRASYVAPHAQHANTPAAATEDPNHDTADLDRFDKGPPRWVGPKPHELGGHLRHPLRTPGLERANAECIDRMPWLTEKQ